MISSKYLLFFGLVIALLSFTVLFNGCESSSDNLAIAPGSATVNAASVQNITFSATGGAEPYTWSVNNSSVGTIVGNGTSAVYTAYAMTGLNLVTVRDANSNSVSATVTQGLETTGQGLTITPSFITVSAASATNSISFTATGGVEPYTWTVGNPNMGILNGIGHGAVYTASSSATGQNFVVVTDFNSHSVSATVVQQ